MPFKKGHKLAVGRVKGNVNKVTADVKEAYKTLVESNIDNMNLWLSRVAAKDPDKALDIMIKMSEYFIPKLARTEIAAQIEDKRLEITRRVINDKPGNNIPAPTT